MSTKPQKHWHVIQTVELGAPARDVWELIGGFYTIHLWHPDIIQTEVPPGQTETAALRRLLTFPGQPKTTEELVMMDNADFHYRYKWHSGEWGEKVKNYFADLRVFDLSMAQRSMVQWSSTFDYQEDALSAFYQNGFRVLGDRFPL
jgi:Polyketide cyclase / dehydrase and lipid transport